jgi:uncharacterized MAPEG superfamily protein
MTPPLLSLLGFALWTLTLALIGIVVPRTLEVLAGRRKANSYAPGDAEESAWRHRVARAHLNCVENLPVYASVVLVLSVAGVSDPLLDTLAWVVLGARLVQSCIHLAGTTHAMVFVRACFFITQVGCIVGMVVQGLRLA